MITYLQYATLLLLQLQLCNLVLVSKTVELVQLWYSTGCSTVVMGLWRESGVLSLRWGSLALQNGRSVIWICDVWMNILVLVYCHFVYCFDVTKRVRFTVLCYCRCEGLAELIWRNRQQIRQVEMLKAQLPIQGPGGILLEELTQNVASLLSTLVTRWVGKEESVWMHKLYIKRIIMVLSGSLMCVAREGLLRAWESEFFYAWICACPRSAVHCLPFSLLMQSGCSGTVGSVLSRAGLDRLEQFPKRSMNLVCLTAYSSLYG